MCYFAELKGSFQIYVNFCVSNGLLQAGRLDTEMAYLKQCQWFQVRKIISRKLSIQEFSVFYVTYTFKVILEIIYHL